MKKRIYVAILILVSIVGIIKLGKAINHIHTENEFRRNVNLLTEEREKVKAGINASEELNVETLYGYTVDIYCEFTDTDCSWGSGSIPYWKDVLVVNIKESEQFLLLTDDEKRALMSKILYYIKPRYEGIYQNTSLYCKDVAELFKKTNTYQRITHETVVKTETSDGTYRLSEYTRSLYRDDEEVSSPYKKASGTEKTESAKESESGGKRVSGSNTVESMWADPDDYDDPDEYADDAEGWDFDDYDEAYDFWENW